MKNQLTGGFNGESPTTVPPPFPTHDNGNFQIMILHIY